MSAQNPIRHSRLKIEEMTGWKLIAYLRGAVFTSSDPGALLREDEARFPTDWQRGFQ